MRVSLGHEAGTRPDMLSGLCRSRLASDGGSEDAIAGRD